MTAKRNPGALRTIATAGIVAGVLDIAFVFAVFGFRNGAAERILQGIAAGLIGREAARNGGFGTVALGLALHFVIALGAAAVFYGVSRKARFLSTYWPVTGPLFGVLVWLFMNGIVLPLSAVPPKSFPPPGWIPVLIAHLVCVGPPIAFIVWRSDRRAAI